MKALKKAFGLGAIVLALASCSDKEAPKTSAEVDNNACVAMFYYDCGEEFMKYTPKKPVYDFFGIKREMPDRIRLEDFFFPWRNKLSGPIDYGW